MSDGDFLSRWSRRKHAARAGRTEPGPPREVIPPAPGSVSGVPAAAATPAVEDRPDEPPPLPPVESLTPESDFTAFMRPEVDGDVRRKALKTLFQDPRYNVMDGLDVYIDDYSKPDPLPAGWLEKLEQVAFLGVVEPKPAPAPAPEAQAEPPQVAAVSQDEPPADASPAAPEDAPEGNPAEVKEAPAAEETKAEPRPD